MGPELETDGGLVEDFVSKMKLTDEDRGKQDRGGGEDDDADDNEEEEFSFDCVGVDNCFSISADDIFHNGQIRPVFPLFDQTLLFRDVDELQENQQLAGAAALRPPVRKLFVEEGGRVSPLSSASSEELEGPYCSWAGKAVDATPEHHGAACKKSNSTGFSKLRRFRELVLRSNSDGKDAFVFLHNHNSNPPVPTSENSKTSKAPAGKKGAGNVAGKKGNKDETASSVHEKYYGKKKKKNGTATTKGVGNKRRSYLPYRQDLVGFFTSANGLSKNVHPF